MTSKRTTRRAPAPKLKFGVSSTPTGFTPVEMASFNDMQPARVVRELIQNSLDAAAEAGRDTAIVRFKVESMTRRSVPDLTGYRKAFSEAVKFHTDDNGNLPDAAKEVAERIQKALDDIGNRDALVVSDNGIGLDPQRMTKLMSNGATSKTDGTGSYGGGHFAVIPTSDLRYVLYAGVNLESGRTVSGMATLATRPGGKGSAAPYGPYGYLVKNLLNGMNGDFYDFIDEGAHPPYLREVMRKIAREWKSGSAVVVPTFNYFGEKRDEFWNIISTVSARNFNAAIFHGRLVVEVEEKNINETLDRDSLESMLLDRKDETRAPRKGALLSGLRISGQNAYLTYEALSDGKNVSVETDAGNASLSILIRPDLRTHLSLYRNGMWITSQIPRMGRDTFADLVPFHAVLKVSTDDGGEFQRLIRKAEGLMHDDIDFKRLNRKEARTLRGLFERVSEVIRSEVPKISSESYEPDDYLVIDDSSTGTQGARSSFAMWGGPKILQRRYRPVSPDPDPDPPDPPNPPGPPGPPRPPRPPRPPGPNRRRRPITFRSTIVQASRTTSAIAISHQDSSDDLMMALKVDENSDSTCDRLGPDEQVTVRRVNFTQNDAGATPKATIQSGGKAVRLQGAKAGVDYQMEIEYQTPDGFDVSVNAPVFRIELVRTPTKAKS